MKDKPQKVYTDERTLQLERKLGNEVYLPEILIILGMEIYAGIRSWQLGLDIRRYNQTSGIRTLRSRLVNGAILAIVIVAVQMWSGNSALRPFFRHHPILQFIFIVALITAFSSIFDQLVDHFYQKMRIRINESSTYK